MKNFLLRFGFFFPAAIFAVYVLMVIIGCVANCYGAGEAFYCGVFCKLGYSLMALTTLYMLYRAIRH